ncbi:MAG: threonylcarbamoyl-AMP synthase [Gammaproteobacteria bacterium]|nr:threonylcarbamoyl-AMP synthase [Gammaproteobacteria bacterium]
MSHYLEIHPSDPQPRFVARAVDIIRAGGVVVYPTDSCYALGCEVGNKAAMGRIRRIRESEKDHHFTLVCADLSEIASYGRVDNSQYRLLRALTPGPYTFILVATREVPKRLQHPRRKTIGIRVPDHPVPQAMLEKLGQPMMSSTLVLPGDDRPLTDPVEIEERLGNRVDAVIASGNCGIEPTTVIDLAGPQPEIVRRGLGDVAALEA